MSKALFLDRDGVINEDVGYTHVWSDNLLISGSSMLIKRYLERNYKIIVVTNQSGIGRGYYDDATFHKFMSEMRSCLQRAGADIDGYYYCACVPSEKMCPNRKPNPGMILRAVSDHNISLESSILVGDKPTDILSAVAAGVSDRYLYAPYDTSLDTKLDGLRYKKVSSLDEIR